MSSRRNYRRMQHEIKSALREKFDAGRGTSKHLDKKANGGKPLMGKIYCDTTLDDYRVSAERFARAAAEDGNCRNMEEAREYVPVWLQSRIDSGKSAWTIKAEASALAKYYGCSYVDFGVDLPIRHQCDVTQHRRDETYAGRFNPEEHPDLVRFCLDSGLRRSEVANLPPERVTLDAAGQCWIHVVQGKGGKDRDVLCLSTSPYELARAAEAAGRSTVFEAVPTAAPIHAYRRMYARSLYAEYAVDPETLPKKERYDCRGAYKGQRFDKAAVDIVTRQLGHTRLGVTVLSYLALSPCENCP